MDSDGEYENGMPIMRTISHDDHNTPAPGVSRKVIKSVCRIIYALKINRRIFVKYARLVGVDS